MLIKNLAQVIGFMPFYCITVMAANYVIAVINGNDFSLEQVLEIKFTVIMLVLFTVIFSVQAIYYAATNKTYNMRLKKVYKYLLLALVLIVLPLLLVMETSKYRECGNEQGCSHELSRDVSQLIERND